MEGRLLASLDRCHPKAGMRSYAKGFFANVSSSPMAAFVIPRGDQLWAGIRWTRFHLALLANCSPRRVGRKLFGGSTFLCFLDIAPIVFDTFEADCFRITFHLIVDMVGLLSYSQIWNDLEILYIYILSRWFEKCLFRCLERVNRISIKEITSRRNI